MRPIVFNGKFYAGGLNGVHRVADRLIHECDALLAATPAAMRPRARLLLPAERHWHPKLQAIDVAPVTGGGSQTWEQLALPRVARDAVIVNLANLAPVRAQRQILLLHDAQFLFRDSGYPLRQRLGYRMLTPLMARRSAVVLTVSHYSRKMLDLLGIVPRDRCEVLYNGADHILGTPAAQDVLTHLGLRHRGYALMFGSPKGYKNNRIVFEAFAKQMPGRQLRLVIVGADRATLEAAGLRVPRCAVFSGPCDDAALRALYEGAHCLLVPSRTEGFGLPPIEAMLCGCPVVVAPAGALPEICRDAALYADVDDAQSWRMAIALLDDPAVRATKIATGSARAAGFTWTRAGRELLGHILRLAEA